MNGFCTVPAGDGSEVPESERDACCLYSDCMRVYQKYRGKEDWNAMAVECLELEHKYEGNRLAVSLLAVTLRELEREGNARKTFG